MERLGPAEHRREGLERDPGQVVERLLRRQRDAGGLGVEAHPGRALVLGAVALGHQPVPDPARGPELGDLLEEVAVAVEEERQARREVVDPQAAREGRLDVGHPVGDREGQLLDRGRAGLADVVAADRDRVPARQLARPELDRVGHQAHRRLRREEVFLLGHELLEDVVLGRPFQPGARHAGLLGGHDVHRPDRGGRRVDRHRRGDALERQAGRAGPPCRPGSRRRRRRSRTRPRPRGRPCRSRTGSACRRRSTARSGPAASSWRNRAFVSSAAPKPANMRIVQSRLR